ncbi:MAG: S-adenosylmethionine:tRNA ribosyltransferase-isomerase, partial [Bacteroidaceae bacterium]|nr:S-adenosylmethionine:tRNA ribosyltransferase-isomerase [Bacteroidaceae bacterium]
EMHSEYIVVKKQTIEKLIAHDGNAIAVGTTSVRTLESLYYIGKKLETNPDASEDDLHVNQWEPYEESRDEKTVVDYLQNILSYLNRNGLAALHTSTQIIIAPGYKYHIVKRMVTNFHQPQSTLLLLVSAFVGRDEQGNENWRKIYRFALSHDFRFLSYGDSSILIPS